MSSHIRRIAICTGGGDAPGLNAVIRSVVIGAANRGWECYGIREGFNGILFPERYPEGGVFRLTRDKVRGIGKPGRHHPGHDQQGQPAGVPDENARRNINKVDRTDEILEFFARKELDALVSVGGDGSLTIANALHLKGLRVVGVPKTIDNDLDKTFTTFGFDTAVAFATECIDRLHSTAESHQRVMVVEVMGRYAGWIALHAGIASSAHAILIPEIPFDLEKVAAKIRARDGAGRMYSIVVVAEGAEPAGGHREILEPAEIGHAERLGGIGERIARALHESTEKDSAGGRAWASAARRQPHLLRSPCSHALWHRRGARAGRGPVGRHGGAGLPQRELRRPGGRRRPHERRPAGLRHPSDWQGYGNLFRRLSARGRAVFPILRD